MDARYLVVGLAWLVIAGPRVDPPSRIVGFVVTHTVAAGETLRSIGSRHGIDPSVIAADNRRSPRAPLRPGDELRLDGRHIVPPVLVPGRIVINVPQRMVFYQPAGVALLAFPIAVGSSGWRTPIGPFTVIEKELDPTWDVPASIAAEAAAKGITLPARVPPGPANPLGRHWLRLSAGSVGLHGTNAPASIYQATTHGCLRAHPDDIAALFPLVDKGTPGVIVYEPVLLADDGEDVFLEVHRDIYRLQPRSSLAAARALADALGLSGRIDWTLAARVVADRDGIARDVTLRR